MRYEWDELDVSANITQYGHNMSAFYRDEHDMSDMSAIRMCFYECIMIAI